MDCILLKQDYDIKKLIYDFNKAESYHSFINPKNLSEKSFSLSNKTYGWEAIPLHTIDGKIGNESTIPVDITNKEFKPNIVLQKCDYFREILNDLDTDIYLVRIMKLKAGGYIAPHKDIVLQNNVIRCHLPIITNPDVNLYMDNVKYYLEPGNLYFINARNKIHYVKNDSKFDRISLVIDLKLNEKLKINLKI